MTIAKRQEKLDAILAKHLSDNHNAHFGFNGRQQHAGVDPTDDEIIAKLREAKNSAKFEQLFDQGDISEYAIDDSRADLALMSMLAFYTQDHDQLDRLFTRSVLCRDKYLKRPDYRRRTIEAAIKGLAETYRASSPSPPNRNFDLELDAEEQRRRVRDLAAGLGKPIPEKLCYLSGLGMPTREAFTLALESCKRYGVRLLILDSLGLAMLGDAGKAADVIGFHNDYIAPFREAGVTVVIIDHQGKLQVGESYQQKTSFGSAYMEHLVRSVIQVEAGDRNREAGTVTLTVRPKKASFGTRRNPFAVRLTFEEEKITTEPDELDETELATEGTLNADDRVKLALRSGPAYSDELADRTELALGTVQNSITRLKKRGEVEPSGDKRGSAEQVRLASSSSFPHR